VGRRLTFDQARGRLWVVCPTCRQWNLSPLEARWEAIEDGERLYRDAKRRVTTDQIGLATLADGTDLIRIGDPLREEFAAWRYGARFRSRRLVYGSASAAVAVLAGVATIGPQLGLVAAGAVFFPVQALWFGIHASRARRVYARGEDEAGAFVVTRAHLTAARVVAAPSDPAGWGLRVQRQRGDLPIGSWGPMSTRGDQASVVLGAQARALARLALPQVNREGASDRAVREATALLAETPDVDALFRTRASRTPESDQRSRLFYAPAPLRLAIEMGLHEDLERRALDGELAALEAQWREAEEVAAIADTLTLPERVVRRLDRLRSV
jgi:hypothetical protein